jgi:uncharacterized protein YcfJ
VLILSEWSVVVLLVGYGYMVPHTFLNFHFVFNSIQGSCIGGAIGSAIFPGVGTIVGTLFGSVFGTFGGMYCTDRILQNVCDNTNYDVGEKQCDKCTGKQTFKKYRGESAQNSCNGCR